MIKATSSNFIATFWAYGSPFDSLEEFDNFDESEPPVRFGFAGTVVWVGGVRNAIRAVCVD